MSADVPGALTPGPSSRRRAMQDTPQEPRVRMTLMSLPVEVHLRIRTELLSDPDTNIFTFKRLRLVCKTFDALWTPVVLSRIVLFRSGGDAFFRLYSLLQSPSHPAQFQALTLRNWCYVKSSRFNVFIRGCRIYIYMFFALHAVSAWIFALLWITGIRSLRLLYAFVHIPVVYIFMFLPYTKGIIPSLRARIVARHYAAQLPQKLKLPNARSARPVANLPSNSISSLTIHRLYVNSDDDEWSIYWSTRMLLALPRLVKLELYVSRTVDMSYISKCLLEVRNLGNIVLRVESENRHFRPSHPINCFRTLIARNPNLLRLTFSSKTSDPCDLSESLRDVRPLRLQHVTIGNHCTNLAALLPHIRSLLSFEFNFRPGNLSNSNQWCPIFHDANVFPPTIKVDLLDSELVTYLTRHPGVVNLTIRQTGQSVWYEALSQVLAQHSHDLRYLALGTHALTTMLDAVQSEMNLLRCNNLREFVVIEASNQGPHHEEQIFPFIARLGCSTMTVVIRYSEAQRYKNCVNFCKNSENALVRRLVGRIVGERYRE